MRNPKIGIGLLSVLLFFGTVTASIPNNIDDAIAIKEIQDYPTPEYKAVENKKEGLSYDYDIGKQSYKEKQEKQPYSDYQTNKINEYPKDYNYKLDTYSDYQSYPGSSYSSSYYPSYEYPPIYVKDPNLKECSNGLLVYDLKNCDYPDLIECPNGLLVSDIENCKEQPFDVSFCQKSFEYYLGFVTEEQRKFIIDNFNQVLELSTQPGEPNQTPQEDILEICTAISVLLEDPSDNVSQLQELGDTLRTLTTPGSTEDTVTSAIINSLIENSGTTPPPSTGTVELGIGKGVECALDPENDANNQVLCNELLGAGSTDLEGVVTTGDFGPTQYDMTLTNDNTPPDVFDIDNTQFVLDVDEGVTTAFVTPGFTYTLAETQIETAGWSSASNYQCSNWL
ncbi:MAG: hypothetical protein MRJ93_04925 [Nitrososphaeraceae archaeon]|nr:hypothetical protein [Nitrososphaeraceae archaeon]